MADIIDPTTMIVQRVIRLENELVPRKEHEAQKIPERLLALETWRVEAVRDLAQTEARLRELIITTISSAVKESLNTELTDSKEIRKQSNDDWKWQVGILFSSVTFVIMLAVTIYLNLHK